MVSPVENLVETALIAEAYGAAYRAHVAERARVAENKVATESTTELRRALHRWTALGVDELDNAVFIGHTALGRLHALFRGMSDLDMHWARQALPIWPPDLEAAYREHNGAFLFENLPAVIRWYGVIDDKALIHRLGGLETERPYSLIENNEPRLPKAVVIGSYCDGSWVCHDGSRVFRCREGHPSRPLAVWPTVQQWLSSEIERLNPMFDDDTGLFTGGDYRKTLPPEIPA